MRCARPVLVLLLLWNGSPCLSQEHGALQARDRMNGPIGARLQDPDAYGSGSNPVLDIYQHWLSPARGERLCPMHPSCSQYAKIAFAELPWYEATLRSMDRLLRCGHDLQWYPAAVVDGEPRWFDPVARVPSTSDDSSHRHHAHMEIPHSVPHPLNSRPPGEYPADDGFAEYLQEQGEYYRAVTEYLRRLHAVQQAVSRDTVLQARLVRRIARCYYDGEDYAGCLAWHERASVLIRGDADARAELFLLSSKSLYHMGRYREAAERLTWSAIGAGAEQYAEKQLVLGLALLRAHDTAAARRAWTPIGRDREWGNAAAALQGELGGLSDLPYRSPALAGIFSALIPGTGYLYAGRPATGLAALLINGLLAWAVTDAVRGGQYGIAATAGFIGLGWYGGNILGSVDAARAANESVYHASVNHMIERAGLRALLR